MAKSLTGSVVVMAYGRQETPVFVIEDLPDRWVLRDEWKHLPPETRVTTQWEEHG